MIEIDFLTIIKEKKFGPIALGSEKEKVIEILGDPDGYSNPEAFDAILYHRFEFAFTENKLTSISHGYIYHGNWRFNSRFHYKNKNFQVSSWFKKPWIHTRLDNIKRKLSNENITFTESVFFDSIKLNIGNDLELLFTSEHSFHKDPEEWLTIDPAILNLRLSHFFLFTPAFYSPTRP